MIILVDMDNTIADFDKSLYQRYKAMHPGKFCVPPEKRILFETEEEYPPELRPLIRPIYSTQGFFESMDPVKGSIAALREMEEIGSKVYICTAPISRYDYCVTEKYRWIDKHLGKEWVKKMIITKDKTLVRGDLLIDDKPEITGLEIPAWEHILYDQPYNRNVNHKRRLNWENWREILNI